MPNKSEIKSMNLTSSPNKSFDSSMKQNVWQLLTVQWSSPKRNLKKTSFTQYGTIRIQKKMTILENLQNSREFLPGILGTVDSNSPWPCCRGTAWVPNTASPGPRPTSVASWSIQLFRHNRHEPRFIRTASVNRENEGAARALSVRGWALVTFNPHLQIHSVDYTVSKQAYHPTGNDINFNKTTDTNRRGGAFLKVARQVRGSGGRMVVQHMLVLLLR